MHQHRLCYVKWLVSALAIFDQNWLDELTSKMSEDL